MSRGTRNFNNCRLKDVVYEPAWQHQGKGEWYPNPSNTVSGSTVVIGFIGRVTCPLTRGEAVRGDGARTRQDARKLLGKEAAAMCSDCRFARLTPTSFYELLIQERNAETEAIQAAGHVAAARQEYHEQFGVLPPTRVPDDALQETTMRLPIIGEMDDSATQVIHTDNHVTETPQTS